MKYEIKELNADGSGAVLFTLDDGSTIGQLVHNMPVDDAQAFHAAIVALAPDVEDRAKGRQALEIAPAVAQLVRQEVVFVKPARAAAKP